MVEHKLGRFVRIAIITFIMSIGFTLLSRGVLSWLDMFSSFFLLLAIVLVGIMFDIVGVATTAAEERPFHAMAADKVSGAKEAAWLVRNADKVGSFTLDVVGDVLGTLSGAVGALIIVRIVAAQPTLNEALASTVLVALVAALTVGGKAVGKGIAFRRRTEIVLRTGRLLYFIERLFGLRVAHAERRSRASKRGDKARVKRANGDGTMP